MDADVIDSYTECEDWDVDDEVVPHDIHEKTVQRLLLRNNELTNLQADNNKEPNSLPSEFNESVKIDDSTNSLSHSERSECLCEYTLVPSDPKKLYVTNISYRTTQNNLWEFFAKYGSVRYCQLLKDHNSKSKGRGFITFTDVATAEYVLNLGPDDLYLDGRYMQVKPAMWKKSNKLDKKQEISLQDEVANQQDSDSLCFIDDISDDIMLEIFSYLSLKELLICERVCRKWRGLCIRRMHSMKHFSLNTLKNQFITGFKPRHFYNLVRRLSPVVQSVDLSMMHRYLGNDAIKTVANHCQHLCSLNLSGLMITNSVLQYLANNCQHLQTILLNSCCKVSDKGLWPLFTKCHGLKEIQLDENGLITGKSFRVAQDKLERLSLAKCTMLQDVALSHLSSRCKQLKSINLSFCNELSSQGIAYVSQFHELEILHLLGSHCSVSLLELNCLNKLQQLYLTGNQTVTEEFLSLVGTCCPNLRILDISDTNVQLDRVRNLCKCRQLETLKANYVTVNKIGCDLVAEGSLMRVVHLRGCQNITAADLLYLVTVAEHLRELDIHNTSVSAAEMTAHLQKLEPERRITLLADDDGDTEPFFMSDDDFYDEEADADLDDAEIYLDGDDPLFAEQFELS